MGEFKRTQIIGSDRAEKNLSLDDIYWKRLKVAAVIQESGLVNSVEFSPVSPFHLAATSSSKVAIYDTRLCEPVRQLTRFKKAVYGASWRRTDGSLLVTGDEEGKVRIFDGRAHGSTGKSALRQYDAYQTPVRCCRFTADGDSVLSAADDGVVKLWRVSDTHDGALAVAAFSEHSDRVRCAAASRVNNALFISGSYDHTCRLWDTRQQASVLKVDHGFPIESVILFPNDSIIATAGGLFVKIWDITSGGKLLTQLNHHHKTVTTLCMGSSNNRLISGGLDRHLKIYDVATYDLVHTLSYSSPILSAAVSPDDEVVAVGTASGNLLSIERRRAENERDLITSVSKSKTKPIERYRLENQDNLVVDQVVIEHEAKQLSQYDRHMKGFRHSQALTCVLKSGNWTKRRPEVLVSVLRELRHRGALDRALAGRDYSTLGALLRFLCYNLSRQRFVRILLHTANRILDVYESRVHELETPTLKLLDKLRCTVEAELEVQDEVLALSGAVDMICRNASATVASTERRSAADSFFGEISIEPITLPDVAWD